MPAEIHAGLVVTIITDMKCPVSFSRTWKTAHLHKAAAAAAACVYWPLNSFADQRDGFRSSRSLKKSWTGTHKLS